MCPNCHHTHTLETAFERWLRNEESCDSQKAGIVRFDLDVLLHRYMMPTDKRGTREIQCLMFIEVKSFGADVSMSQRDTFSLLSQVLRNRRTNKHQAKKGRHANEHTPVTKCYSHLLNKDVTLRLFGGHLLQMSGEDPPTSEWLKWDKKPIDLDQLKSLLRFEIDPDTLRAIDWRRRYSDFKEEFSLFTTGLQREGVA